MITIPYQPFHYQEEFHKDPARFKIIAGGRRVGKTKCATHEAIRHCLTTPDRLVLWVAPTFRESREVGFSEFISVLDYLQPAIHSIHSSQLYTIFKNGSKIYWKSSDNPDSLRGRSITLAVLDEAAFHKETVFDAIIRPSLSDRKGRAILLSTPNGFNYFHKIYTEAAGWSKYHWATEINPIIGQEEIDQVKSQISQVDFDQEYLAKFITKAGRVYADFGRENTLSEFQIKPEVWDIYLGMDFGYASPTAIAFIGVDRATKTQVVQFDELYLTRTQIDDIINAIFDTLHKHGLKPNDLSTAFTDPAGNAEELSSGISPVDAMRARGIHVVNKASSIQSGLALVRSFIKNVKGERRYRVTQKCKETIRSFEGYQYAVDKWDNPIDDPLKDGDHDHMMDAVRYFFVNKFDHARWVAQTPDQRPYTMGSSSCRVMKRCTSCKRPFISSTPKGEPPHICKECRSNV